MADFNAGRALRPDARPFLTHVELTWLEGRIEHWIRFGHDCGETILDRRRCILRFAACNVFAFVRGASNDFGTIVSRIDIVRAIDRGEFYQTLPFVRPGGEILLRISGWPKVERVLRRSTPWRRSASIPLAVPPIIGCISTTASSPVSRQGPTAANSIAPGSCAGGLRWDALRLRHHHLRRNASSH